MIRAFAFLALLALMAAAPFAQAADATAPSPMTPDGRLMLRRGERAVIGLDAAMHITIKRIEHIGPNGALLGEDKPAEGEVALYMGQDATAGSFLRIENGTSQALHFKATIVVPRDNDLDYVPTSICTVVSHTFGLETWPNDVIGMVLGPFAQADPEKRVCVE